ncbi:MAG: DUF4406 domain-containing protein [Candidatus Staskawiczbacteria bacterium RIFOXYC1_FULL_37_43]|nr:MAG: DUF4406 domain-containing protein [Candidatus Staskawiczbacteria bacterium RIFCSPHIGHO2_01_FULL_37_17]OGZ71222.1 MAG: DUF4406 domain-containing protein [Candidatus Staskawiczbacteria bacterium RIFCSPLOWO2_01_FULL_37_19]OGZ75638.1 MAG: DUF4406 domain-containing protein [Candidatus Staskawiczbacteria bacterium RIFOXYA1_FULL_37_15]OGZ76662.1 MAG: DUF4406 domain-containing protein [Candidatus Staskawiczbacteria bacterium RIFOXYA12_FULL_37_10]OGZ79914.1 MAG: DUF4406 domain-containing protein
MTGDRKKIYICSPLSGNIEENIEKAKEHCRDVSLKGFLPIASHIYFTQFLDDNNSEERDIGMEMGLELLKLCDEVWVFGDKISEGMKKEIQFAKKLNIEIKYN